MAWTALNYQILEHKFGERAMKERLSLTPGTPRFTARRLKNPEDHETYRSGVGTLLYLTKQSRPDICNPVRELSKTMDAPAPVQLKEMYKVIRHVLSTKGYVVEFLGLTTFNSLLQYVNWLVWEVCSVN